jgi:hypothetical protein
MARATWLRDRSGLIGLSTLFGLFAFVIVLERFTHPVRAGLGSVNTDAFTPVVFAVMLFPLVIGVFVGAPLLSREIQSGTFRFTWTQGVGRTRFLVTTLVMFLGVTAVSACALGALLGWYAHLFELAGVESQWQSGLFDTTPVTLVAWALFALVLGTFIGALVGKTVTSMAATTLGVGGLFVASFMDLIHRLLAISPLSTSEISPFGIGLGTLNTYGGRGLGPSGSWLVRAWYTGPGGHVLGTGAAQKLLYQLASMKDSSVQPTRWLALRHYAFWVSYQPASRFWIFQGIVGVILVGLSTLILLGTLRILRHRA